MRKIRSIGMTACIFGIVGALAAGGCTDPVGSRLNQEPGKVTMGNSSPNTISRSVEGESNSAAAAGATGQTVIDTNGTLTSLFGGVPLGSLSLPTPAGRGVLNTNGDLVIKATRISTGGGENAPTVIDGLEVSSNKSKVQATLAPLYQIMAPAWEHFSDNQKDQVVQTFAEGSKVSADVVKAAIEAFVSAAAPVP